MQSSDLKQQIELLCIERGLDQDEVLRAIEVAIASAYRREFGQKEHAYEAKFDTDDGTYAVYRTIEVVDTVENPDREVTLMEARLSNPTAQVGDVIREELAIHEHINFGRIASQVAKQVLAQSISNARHSRVIQQFKDKVGDVVSVEVDGFRKGGYNVKLSQTTGFISKDNLLPIDKFRAGQLIKALILDITEDDRGNSRIVLSRSHPNFVKAIIANEVPEVASGIVIIDKIVREAGSRSKILVSASEEDPSIDPVGTILGRKNVRLVNIMREISGSLQEKIDVIENRPEDMEGMIMDALEPAEIERVEFHPDGTADVFCYPEEASLAVGRRGVNIRLASELTGHQLNIKTLEDSSPASPEILVS